MSNQISEKEKLCYMDAGSFIVHIKTDDVYKNIAEDVETGLTHFKLWVEQAIQKRKNKKIIDAMKDSEDHERIYRIKNKNF